MVLFFMWKECGRPNQIFNQVAIIHNYNRKKGNFVHKLMFESRLENTSPQTEKNSNILHKNTFHYIGVLVLKTPHKYLLPSSQVI